MAQTASQTNPLNVLRMATGTFIEGATAVAVDITCGFKPRYVRVENETDRNGYEWFEFMADAEAIKTVAAGTKTLITTLGITPAARGFNIGLDLDVNVVSKQISWYALG